MTRESHPGDEEWPECTGGNQRDRDRAKAEADKYVIFLHYKPLETCDLADKRRNGPKKQTGDPVKRREAYVPFAQLILHKYARADEWGTQKL
jgi:hypothetical protein